jgi:predicted  nucleic acid-binding Zn-ribbon protein
MGPVLNGLIKLQSVENHLRAAKAKLARCRRSVIIQENQVRNLQNALEAKREEIQLTKVQCDRLELELKTRDEQINKLRASLNNAKTNKEYAALLTQLNTTKADNVKIETQILDLLKAIEADETECKEIEEQINQQKQQLDQTRKKAEASAVEHEAEIERIQAEWDEVASTIPPGPLATFKRVAETYDGQAVVTVERQQGRTDTYSCGGCFMGITAESVNLLMTKDDIIRCPNCTRILVLSSEDQKIV